MYAHNMVRVTTCVPVVALADPIANAAEIERLYSEACSTGTALVVRSMTTTVIIIMSGLP